MTHSTDHLQFITGCTCAGTGCGGHAAVFTPAAISPPAAQPGRSGSPQAGRAPWLCARRSAARDVTTTKRLRFEIFRRDNHACRYCGATAPDAALTIDHVLPVALGGNDEPANLVTACRDCNAGKSASSPDADLVADVSADALRWGQAMKRAAELLMAEYRDRVDLHQRFADHWNEWKSGTRIKPTTVPLEGNWERSIDTFLAAGLPMEVLHECTDLAMNAQHIKPENTFRYMCGIAWRKVGEIREIASAIIETDQVE